MTQHNRGFLDRWAAQRHGLRPDKLSISAVLERIPRLSGLRYGATGSPLGGRIAPHLKHPSDEESEELIAAADKFLEETPSEPVGTAKD